MRKISFPVLAVVVILVSLLTAPVSAQKKAHAQSQGDVWAGPVTEWPRIIPARISEGENKDLLVMTLGEVETSLAQGEFDPVKDQVILKDGSVIRNYYRDTLGVKFYQPIPKKIFPLPPSGLCTWYYYYQHITDREVRLNVDWIAENLKSYGAKYVQIDDGWQALSASGRKGSRDWTGFDPNFSGGMADLASYIKSKGLVPGIWIAPHGQSNEGVVKSNPGVFILKPDGTSPSKTWEGDWLLDPTSEAGKKYFHDLFAMMRGWGYEYFKIDGQPIVVDEYGKHSQFLAVPGGAADSLYRVTLDIARDAIGDESYLLGCWGLPIEGAGIMDGSRTGGDVVLGWDGFFTALDPTLESYWQHNIVWYTDPDVMLLRQPLTVEQARVWATLQGLTGQALLSSDRLTDLSVERIDMMRKVYPAVDIRPLDLFPAGSRKRIWDLKVNHLDRRYDVAGLFNFDASKPVTLALNWKELGIEANGPVHVFDYWNGEYMGNWESGISLEIMPASVRVLTLLPDNGKIQLVSTSRHITQGWVDLRELQSDGQGTVISGVSTLPSGNDYRLHFAYPRGKYYRVKSATAMAGKKKLEVGTTSHQGWSEVSFTAPASGDISWSVTFEPDYAYSYTVRQPEGVSVEPDGLNTARVTWRSQYYLNVGYQVYLDGKLLGYTPNSFYVIGNIDPQKEYTVDVRTVWDDGTVNQRNPSDTRNYEVTFTLSQLMPVEVSLSDLGWTGSQSWYSWPVIVDGKRFPDSFGMSGGAVRKYKIGGVFRSLSASVSVDDNIRGARPGQTVVFIVSGDGRELWRSTPMGADDTQVAFEVSLEGVKELELAVETGDGESRFGGLPADWIKPVLKR